MVALTPQGGGRGEPPPILVEWRCGGFGPPSRGGRAFLKNVDAAPWLRLLRFPRFLGFSGKRIRNYPGFFQNDGVVVSAGGSKFCFFLKWRCGGFVFLGVCVFSKKFNGVAFGGEQRR